MDRRQFLFISSGAALGTFWVSGLAEAADQSPLADSALVTGIMKPLRHKVIPGFLSEQQLAVHHDAHYGGALKKYLQTDKQLHAGGDISPDTRAKLRSIRTSRANSVLLHEIYFDGMTTMSGGKPKAKLAAAIKQRFGSYDKWLADFIATGTSSAGWALLVRHPVNGRLYNVGSEEHAIGVLWMAAPLVALDVYEHAFYIDYENRKGAYVEKFMDYIDWGAAERLEG
jgi:Fe-Mn family superoxide dismutase